QAARREPLVAPLAFPQHRTIPSRFTFSRFTSSRLSHFASPILHARATSHSSRYDIATMSTPELSDTLTDGIRVGASAYYIPDQSDPDRQQFSFGYNIVIVNSGAEPAQLISRHWIIIDAHGRREEV